MTCRTAKLFLPMKGLSQTGLGPVSVLPTRPVVPPSSCYAWDGGATVHADSRTDKAVEQIVGRLSLEPSVTAARWRVEALSD